MDIAILAGGYGTRLEGLWDGPKCLVRYNGRPVIERLVDQALEFKPRKVFLLLGNQASKVVEWRECCCPHRDVVPIIETIPSGTATAIRNAYAFLQLPLLILNGDTVFWYDLAEIVSEFDAGTGDTIVAWTDCYAGAGVFGAKGMDQILYSKETDLDVFVNSTRRVLFPLLSFLDVGTPEGFRRATYTLT